MARFYFDLHECGKILEDEDGVERSIRSLREEAIRAAREIMCEELTQGHLCLSYHIAVRDETNQIVLMLPFKDAVAITGI